MYGFIHCTPPDLHDRIWYLNNLHGFASMLEAQASGVYAQFLDFLTHPTFRQQKHLLASLLSAWVCERLLLL